MKSIIVNLDTLKFSFFFEPRVPKIFADKKNLDHYIMCSVYITANALTP